VFRFTIRDVLWLTVVVGLGAALMICGLGLRSGPSAEGNFMATAGVILIGFSVARYLPRSRWRI
jgi:hypothetical protein